MSKRLGFIINQGGDDEPHYFDTSWKAAKWLCEIYGWDFSERYEGLCKKLDGIKSVARNNDLGLVIQRY